MAPQPSPDLSSTSINTVMLENDCGAIGIDVHGAVAAFEVSSDVRSDRCFPQVETSIVSTLSSPRILLYTTPSSETKDPRPNAGTSTHTSTVTYFTANRSTTVTKSNMTIGVTPPSSMTQPSAMRHLAFRMTDQHTATKFQTKVGATRSSEYTATHHQLVLYMLLTKTASIRPPTTKFNSPRFFPHYSHPPYDTTSPCSVIRHSCSTTVLQ